MVIVEADRTAAIWRLLEDVPDPEIPVLSVVDLGIVRYVRWGADDTLHVGLTPTYTGCPATEVIRGSVRRALTRAGYAGAQIDTVLSPPWTSDWLTHEGRQKLAVFGIAPPTERVVACPTCGSDSTEKISEFGSTPCKAHYRCTECLEPFDYFKCF